MKSIFAYLLFFLCLSLFSCDQKADVKGGVDEVPTIEENTLTNVFSLLPPSHTTINFSNRLPETKELNVLKYTYYYNGGGVSVGDINNDNLPDLFFTGNLVHPKLYLNLGGLKFKEITKEAGLISQPGWRTGTTMADVNSDGFLDIYICRSGKMPEDGRRNELFINNQNGTFSEQSAKYGLNDPGYGTQAAFFDYDRDGDLDMYLLNHQIVNVPNLNKSLDDLRNTVSPFAGDKLFQNNYPDNSFTDVSRKAGIRSNFIGFGLGIGVGDLNNDGWPDLYVSNDFMEPDYLYINKKNGTFAEVLKTEIGHTPFYSMGNDIADVNNDGFQDIIATDMMPEGHFRQKTNMASMSPEIFQRRVKEGFHYQYMFNTLQINNGNDTYSDIGKLAGISKTDWSWATLFADFDNDGWKDLFISNGMRKETWNNDFRQAKEDRLRKGMDENVMIAELLPMLPASAMPNYMFHNNKDYTFSNVSERWGLKERAFSNGATYSDLDNDGDLDLIINNIDELAYVYENKLQQTYKSNFIRVKFTGQKANPFGIGTKVEIVTNSGVQVQELYLSRGFQSSVDTRLHFGISENRNIEKMIITWPDGKTQELLNVEINKEVLVDYSNATTQAKQKNAVKTMFQDVSSQCGIDFKHNENPFDDFAREILLPHKMSTLGPALSVGDINNDGNDDIFIGGAVGQSGELYLQNDNQQFKKLSGPWSRDAASEDIAAVFFDVNRDGFMDLYVGSGGNEYQANDIQMQDRLYINDGTGSFTKSKDALPKMNISTGTVSAYDFDGDGDEDLFVGGRQIPGKYPYPPKSFLLQNDKGKFTDVTKEICPDLNSIGMVSCSEWVDLNKDGRKDLLLVGEWMPVTALIWKDGKLVNKSNELGLENTNGWWYSVHSADLDSDGDMDFVAGNLGLNYKYKASDKKPFHIYSTDFDENGRNDIVLAYHESEKLYPLRGRECSSQQVPVIQTKFPTYNAFGTASLEDVYGKENLNSALHYQAKNFASAVFEQTESGFVMHKLPNEAQFSSINGICAGDFDNDGILDLLIAGNMYDSEIETPRNDGGIGMFLKGLGKCSYKGVSVLQSGFYIPRNVKNMSLVKSKSGSECVIGVRNNDSVILLEKK